MQKQSISHKKYFKTELLNRGCWKHPGEINNNTNINFSVTEHSQQNTADTKNSLIGHWRRFQCSPLWSGRPSPKDRQVISEPMCSQSGHQRTRLCSPDFVFPMKYVTPQTRTILWSSALANWTRFCPPHYTLAPIPMKFQTPDTSLPEYLWYLWKTSGKWESGTCVSALWPYTVLLLLVTATESCGTELH